MRKHPFIFLGALIFWLFFIILYVICYWSFVAILYFCNFANFEKGIQTSTCCKLYQLFKCGSVPWICCIFVLIVFVILYVCIFFFYYNFVFLALFFIACSFVCWWIVFFALSCIDDVLAIQNCCDAVAVGQVKIKKKVLGMLPQLRLISCWLPTKKLVCINLPLLNQIQNKLVFSAVAPICVIILQSFNFFCRARRQLFWW